MGRLIAKLIGRDPHNDLSRLDVLDGVGRVTAGIPKQRRIPEVGDRVTVSWWAGVGDGAYEDTLDGWLLPSRPGWVRIAASPDDDGTGDADDFMRAAFLVEDVRVTAW